MEKKYKEKEKNTNYNGIIYKRENIIKWIIKQSYNVIINGYYERWSERPYIVEIDNSKEEKNGKR